MRGTLGSRAVRQMVIVLTAVSISCGGDRTREALREAAAAGMALDQRLPALTIEHLHEGPAELVDLLGARLTVINFWGTWCKPCEREMPHLVALQDKWGEHGVQVLGVTIRSYNRQAIEEWIEHFEIQFPTLIGKSFDWMSQEFGIAPALPRTLLVDSESGRIVHLWAGARSQEDLERGLRSYWRETWGDLPETPSPNMPGHGSDAGAPSRTPAEAGVVTR